MARGTEERIPRKQNCGKSETAGTARNGGRGETADKRKTAVAEKRRKEAEPVSL